jgi:hypothetical protein
VHAAHAWPGQHGADSSTSAAGGGRSLKAAPKPPPSPPKPPRPPSPPRPPAPPRPPRPPRAPSAAVLSEQLREGALRSIEAQNETMTTLADALAALASVSARVSALETQLADRDALLDALLNTTAALAAELRAFKQDAQAHLAVLDALVPPPPPAPSPPPPASPPPPDVAHLAPFAAYTMESFLASAPGAWEDASGSGHAGTVFDVHMEGGEGGFGAAADVSYVAGSPSSWIRFAELRDEHTVCAITRYTSQSQAGRIVDGVGANWLQGHHMGCANVAYYAAAGWVVGDGSACPVQDNMQWSYMCGSGTSIYANGTRVASVGAAHEPPGLVVINAIANPIHWTDQNSHFGVLEVLLFNRTLAHAEMLAVQAHQAAVLSGVLRSSASPPPGLLSPAPAGADNVTLVVPVPAEQLSCAWTSSEQRGYECSLAVDGRNETFWAAGAVSDPALTIRFAQPVVLARVVVVLRPPWGPSETVSAVTIDMGGSVHTASVDCAAQMSSTTPCGSTNAAFPGCSPAAAVFDDLAPLEPTSEVTIRFGVACNNEQSAYQGITEVFFWKLVV